MPADTCLFTGEVLSPDTHEEHTIPEKLGGRVRSRLVTSDQFNNKCGSTIDRDLIDRYWPLMMALGPLVATAHTSGVRSVKVQGSEDHYRVDGKGVLGAPGTTITARDPFTGRPVGAAAPTRAQVEKVLGPLPAGAKIQWSYLPEQYGRAKFPRSKLLAPEIELAVLKAGLLTFDHMLRGQVNRFTRSPSLESLRQEMREIITAGAESATFLYRHSLGIQYERTGLLHDLRSRTPFPQTDFEHVVVVSSNPPTRTLDLVLWLFKTDPYGFRLSSDWPGAAFTSIVVNGVLRDTVASEAFQLPITTTLCRETRRRCTAGSPPTDDERRFVADEIDRAWLYTLGRAVYLVEMESAWFVKKHLRNALLPSGEPIRLVEIARLQLRRMYGHWLTGHDEEARFDTIFQNWAESLPMNLSTIVIAEEKHLDSIDWELLVFEFRKAVKALREEFGYPGDFQFQHVFDSP